MLPQAEERAVKSILRTHDIARKFVASLENVKNEAPLREGLSALARDGSLASKAARDLVKGALETFHFRLNVDCKALESAPSLSHFLEGLVAQGRLKAHHVAEIQQAATMAHKAVLHPDASRDALETHELARLAQDPERQKLAPFVKKDLKAAESCAPCNGFTARLSGPRWRQAPPRFSSSSAGCCSIMTPRKSSRGRSDLSPKALIRRRSSARRRI